MKDWIALWGGGSLLTLFAMTGFWAPARAQYEAPPPPAAYALEDVTVIHGDGTREEGVNLVVRGGFISALGPGVPIPDDARVLEGDSLRVYPGMVDAHGKAELELPQGETSGTVLPWAPSREAQGFTPHRLAAHYLVGTGPDGLGPRTAGVIAAGIHLHEGMAPGQSAAVLFRKDAQTPWQTVARAGVGLSFSFQGARGVYPSTLFGVMAHFRQMFADAGRDGLIRSEYERGPMGLLLPTWDPDMEVLRRAASGQLPVFFAANTSGDIRRVLDLADEIGFRPLIVGGEEAWEVAQELGAREVPVLVSVSFPAPMEWEPPEPEELGGEAPAEEEELEPAAAREKERLEKAYANPARLVEAGITVALTSGGDGGDFREGVAKAMEYGLGESDALRAVTTVPASILGIPHVTTVAEEMAANFIVTDGPLFHPRTEILYTFVEGRMETGREGRRRASPVDPSVDVTGAWDVRVAAEGMALPFTMTLTQEGDRFAGSMSSPEAGEARVTGGTVSGNELTFTLVFTSGTESMELNAEALVEGDSMTGKGNGPLGSFTFSGARKPGATGGSR